MDPDFRCLHGVRLKGIAPAGAISLAWQVKDASTRLDALLGEGLLSFREAGRVSGYLLSTAGQERLSQLLGDLVAAVGEDAIAALNNRYQMFEPLNGEFKEMCTAWQGDRDRSRIDDLAVLHDRVLPLVSRCGRAVEHYSLYPARFTEALRLLSEGDDDFFTGLFKDSYHQVWMELHEDLIAVLGRTRTADDA